MNNDTRQLQEILQNEQWLERALPADGAESTENLKLRVRVELGEQWLRTQWSGLPAEPVPHDLQEAVRNAVGQSPDRGMAHAGRTPIKTWRWISRAGLGLAAMLFISLSIFKTNESEIWDSDDEIVLLEETDDSEEFDDELDDALAEVDDLLASRDETEWENVLEGL